MKVGVAQSIVRDPVERRCRDHASKGTRSAETDVVGHDQQDVRRVLGRRHAWRPIRFGLGCVDVDLTTKLRRRGGEIPAINRLGSGWRTWRAVDLRAPACRWSTCLLLLRSLLLKGAARRNQSGKTDRNHGESFDRIHHTPPSESHKHLWSRNDAVIDAVDSEGWAEPRVAAKLVGLALETG